MKFPSVRENKVILESEFTPVNRLTNRNGYTTPTGDLRLTKISDVTTKAKYPQMPPLHSNSKKKKNDDNDSKKDSIHLS